MSQPDDAEGREMIEAACNFVMRVMRDYGYSEVLISTRLESQGIIAARLDEVLEITPAVNGKSRVRVIKAKP